jgi:alkylation response protein AidB-like acyl-CoA dehydrogenase
MNFDYSEEQTLFKDSLARMMTATYSLETRQDANTGNGKADGWAKLAELGALSLGIEEAYGGFGGVTETLIVTEALGRHLVREPYLETVIQAAGILQRAGSAQQKEQILGQIAEGTLKLAVAHEELQARHDLHHVTTRAARVDAGWVINGDKRGVLYGDRADILIVGARTSGSDTDAHGISLFLLAPDTEGVTVKSYDTQDSRRAADIAFNNVHVSHDAVVGVIDQASAIIGDVFDHATAGLCMEAVGAMSALHELTVDYLKIRKQFGVSIGSFQALQHRAVDMYIALEQARSMALYAMLMTDSSDLMQRKRAVSAAKVQINKSARFIGQQAVQLHGGIGMTTEYQAGHYFKRLTMIESQFGDTDYHAARLERVEA